MVAGRESWPGIHRIEAPLDDRYVALHLLRGTDRVVLIDSGVASTPAQHLVPYLELIGIDPASITDVVVTHADFDHLGGNAAVKALSPDASIRCHPGDRHLVGDIDALVRLRYDEFADDGVPLAAAADAWIREQAAVVPVDEVVVDAQELDLGDGWRVRFLHLPGHSDGHLGVHDLRSNVAIIGDAVMGDALLTTAGDPRYPPTYRRVRDYRATIDRLMSLGLDGVLAAHYPVMGPDDGATFLERSRAFVARLEVAVLDELSVEARTTPELVSRLNAHLGRWPQDADDDLAFPVVGHLEDLRERGLVSCDGGRPRCWSMTNADATTVSGRDGAATS